LKIVGGKKMKIKNIISVAGSVIQLINLEWPKLQNGFVSQFGTVDYLPEIYRRKQQ